ncbi:hypothetical protein GN156_10770 [bacterium LRH843]|nr:hypothetical protein [bacterium LRH843]
MDIKNIAIKYVMENSNNNSVQNIANIKCYEKLGEIECYNILSLPVEEFCNRYNPDITKDYVYKNDFLTPRNVYLINPLYYLYYTYLTFKIVDEYLDINGDLNFSNENVHVFYAGLYSKQNSINTDHYKYIDSYKNFQEKREEYIGKSALKIDIRDFFDSIKLTKLFEKLKRDIKRSESIKIVIELEYLLNYCEFDVLPQLNYSIASSILSQIYLMDFDHKIRLNMPFYSTCIRYVDDMYFVNNLNEDIKEFNDWINLITHFLWEDNLNLNSFKTKILTEEEYEKHIKIPENPYGRKNSLFIELINNKSLEVVFSSKFLQMINELSEVERMYGVDMKKYSEIVEIYLSVEGDYTNKVLSDIIYSGKWRLINENQLRGIIENWKVILFNPLHFTVLFIMINHYFENESNINIKEVIDYLMDREILTFRDLILGVTVLLQYDFNNIDLLNKISEIDGNFVHYINKFILGSYVY